MLTSGLHVDSDWTTSSRSPPALLFMWLFIGGRSNPFPVLQEAQEISNYSASQHGAAAVVWSYRRRAVRYVSSPTGMMERDRKHLTGLLHRMLSERLGRLWRRLRSGKKAK